MADGRGRRIRPDGPPRRGPGGERRPKLDEDGQEIPSTTAPDADWQPEAWIDEGPVRSAAGDAVARGRTNGGKPRRRASSAKKAEGALELDRKRLNRTLGVDRAGRTIQRLADAADAYRDEHYEDAVRIVRPLAESLPDEPAIRELYGLSLYRLGKWRSAIHELSVFATLTGSVEQHPVLADCHRAMGHHNKVEELWDELGEVSPTAAVMAEGRIVLAGSLADQGRLRDAIATIEAGQLGGKKDLKEHHLRMRYVLADLYDRAGDRHQAIKYFRSIYDREPGYDDVAERLSSLS